MSKATPPYIHQSTAPALEDFSNRQLSLFQDFLFNTKEQQQKLSNTIELWDSVPRYSIGRRQQNTLRDEKTGSLPKYVLTFNYKGASFRAEIMPAKIDALDENGKPLIDERGLKRTVEYYPSNREELVEDGLRKLASQQSYGFMRHAPNVTSGVTFSLYELRTELTERGHSFSFQELVTSLTILSQSHIDIYREGDEKEKSGWISSNYLPLLMTVSQKKLQADPTSKCIVHFHPFITQGIDSLTYRQFNYAKMMSLKTQLTRWLHKYLCMKFTYAGLTAPPFEIYYKTIKRDSGLLKEKNERKNFLNVDAALNELKEKNILADWTKNDILGLRGKKLDATYQLTPSTEFVREVKAANKRQSNTTSEALCQKPHELK